MEKLFDNKQNLYSEIVSRFEDYLKSNGQTTDDINTDQHFISRRQFFYMKNISKGKEAPDLSEKKMNSLLELLKVKLETSYLFKLSEL